MTRRKRESTARMNEPDYQHIVELPIPSDGFRETSYDMVAFHRERGLATKYGRGRKDEGQWYARYCFADPTVADASRDQFGGERLTSPRSSL